MEGRLQIAVPSLLYYEVANILLFGRSRPPVDEATEALGDLFSIPLLLASSCMLWIVGQLVMPEDNRGSMDLQKLWSWQSTHRDGFGG